MSTSSPATTPRQGAFSPRQAAAIAGAAYLVTTVTSIYALYLYSTLIARGDAARTASNIVAHAQLFRVALLCDLLTFGGCVILNVALYELLAPVHRSLALLAAFWRMAEVSVYAAGTVSGFVGLSLLTGADDARAFQPRELHVLARAFMSAESFGFTIAMVFLSLGSTVYMYLLLRSRYVPKALAVCGICLYSPGALFFLARLEFPAFVAAAFAAVRGLPAVALVSLAVIFLPILTFEVTLGLWLLVKGVRVPELL